jgi:hypothetical protein
LSTEVGESEWPDGVTPESARLALVLASMYELQEEEGGHQRMLAYFLRTAWPSTRGQDQ